MNEMIWTSSVKQDKYVELVKERDRLRKEAFQLRQKYICVFGELILKVFEKKIECIRKKKMIAYCQAAINRGEAIDQTALQAYLAKEMKEYQKQLKEMVKENEDAQSDGEVTQAELMKIKKTYHRIAKRIHPDIFPRTQEEPVLIELWNRTSAAYACNDLETLIQCELLINKALDELGIDVESIDIPDIEEKIKALEAEILKIRETDPYQYKYLLGDEEAVAEKKSPFCVCPVCGYSDKLPESSKMQSLMRKHKNYRQFDCNNEEMEVIRLGHSFKTDVARFIIPSLDSTIHRSFAKALSFMYALLEGISVTFNIERRDIDGLVEPNRDLGTYDILLYDNVPGGAGHVKRLVDKDAILKSLGAAREKVAQKCCDEGTSCYNCLRNYNNQKYHELLTRQYALEILEDIIAGIKCHE